MTEPWQDSGRRILVPFRKGELLYKISDLNMI